MGRILCVIKLPACFWGSLGETLKEHPDAERRFKLAFANILEGSRPIYDYELKDRFNSSTKCRSVLGVRLGDPENMLRLIAHRRTDKDDFPFPLSVCAHSNRNSAGKPDKYNINLAAFKTQADPSRPYFTGDKSRIGETTKGVEGRRALEIEIDLKKVSPAWKRILREDFGLKTCFELKKEAGSNLGKGLQHYSTPAAV